MPDVAMGDTILQALPLSPTPHGFVWDMDSLVFP